MLKIQIVTFALNILCQLAEFIEISERDKRTVGTYCPHVQRSSMVRQTVERLMRPKQHLSPVTHVLVPKWTRTGGMENSSLRSSSICKLVVDPNRFSITVALNGVLLSDFAKRRHSQDGYLFSKDRSEICLNNRIC